MVSAMAVGPFGRRLAQIRTAKGWSRNELARRSGLNRQSIDRWESTDTEPIWSSVVALARALGVSTEEFSTDSPEPSGDEP
jgi:transcriptional regulator with XRE-family HTH domain